MRKILLAALLVLFSMTALYGEEVYYVQSLRAKVMASPSLRSDVIAEVGRGHKLIAIGREGSWIKVKFKDKDGYIASVLVSEYPPMGKQGLITGEEATIKEGARRRASTFVSAAAARGLTPEERKRLSKEVQANYEALEKVESISISDEELERFIKEGI